MSGSANVVTAIGQPHFGIINPPEELWMLADRETGNFIKAFDCAGEPLLVYTCWDDAIQGADAHEQLWDIDCEPVRIR